MRIAEDPPGPASFGQGRAGLALDTGAEGARGPGSEGAGGWGVVDCPGRASQMTMIAARCARTSARSTTRGTGEIGTRSFMAVQLSADG